MIYMGDLTVESGSDYSHLTEVTGYIDCSGADTQDSFSKLKNRGLQNEKYNIRNVRIIVSDNRLE